MSVPSLPLHAEALIPTHTSPYVIRGPAKLHSTAPAGNKCLFSGLAPRLEHVQSQLPSLAQIPGSLTKPFETPLQISAIGSAADLLEAYGLQQAAKRPRAPPPSPDSQGCGEGAALEGKGPHWEVEGLEHTHNRTSLPKLPPIEPNDQELVAMLVQIPASEWLGEQEQKALLAAGHQGATSPTHMSPSMRSPSSINLSTQQHHCSNTTQHNPYALQPWPSQHGSHVLQPRQPAEVGNKNLHQDSEMQLWLL